MVGIGFGNKLYAEIISYIKRILKGSFRTRAGIKISGNMVGRNGEEEI